MFKKERDLAERSKTQLKKSEVKALIAQVRTQLGADVTDLIGGSKAVVFATKLASRTVIYSSDEAPLFFDVEGRNNLFPTVFALWRCPSLLPVVKTHPPVSTFLLRGADLMAPGISNLSDLASLAAESKVCVQVEDNPRAFAVGVLGMTHKDILASGRTGRAVTVLHVFDDCLCAAAVGASARAPPGFSAAAIEAADGVEAIGDIGVVDGKQGEEGGGDVDGAGGADMEGAVLRSTLLCLKHVVREADLPLLLSALWTLIQRCHVSSSASRLDIKRTRFRKVSTYMQHLADLQLLTLSLAPPDEATPTSGAGGEVLSLSAFTRTHELYRGVRLEGVGAEAFRASVLDPSAAAAVSARGAPSKGVQLVDLYRTNKSFREVLGSPDEGEFPGYFTFGELKQHLMAVAATQGLEDARDRSKVRFDSAWAGVAVVDMDMVRSAGTAKAEGKVEGKAEERGERGERGEEEELEESPLGGTGMVGGVWVPSTSSLGALGVGGWGVDKGVAWKPIDMPRPPPVAKPHVVEVVAAPVEYCISKEAFVRAVLSKLGRAHAMVSEGSASVGTGKKPSVSIDQARKAGNKVVTMLSGLQAFRIDLPVFMKDCQKKFACSVSLGAAPGKPLEQAVCLQGSFGAELETFLVEGYGIPRTAVVAGKSSAAGHKR